LAARPVTESTNGARLLTFVPFTREELAEMHREEADDLDECVDCRAVISPSVGRSFTFGDDVVLCFDCSLKRGGKYDPERELWHVPPNVSGLVRERHPEL
jgi:hypothetical protein